MILKDISPYFKNRFDRLARWSSIPSLWQDHANKILAESETDLPNADAAFDLLHRIQRLEYIFAARMENHKVFRDYFYRGDFPTWKDFTDPEAPMDLQRDLADKLYNVRNEHDVPMLEIGDHARSVGCFLFDRCVAEGVKFDVAVFDENFKALLLNHCDVAQAASFGELYALSRSHITTRIVALYNLPEHDVIAPDWDKKHAYDNATRIFRERVLAGGVHYTLTTIPTRVDAAIDELDYKQYVTDFFTMCNQDWAGIEQAQSILIEKLDATKMLRFTNDDGTDLTMSVEGFTFCNSVIARNIPGSEVFSAPAVKSVNGTIVAKGRFAVKNTQGSVIEDITMHFKDGYLHDYHVAKGKDVFENAINTDAGARYVGEIGIGTNPFWKKHVASILIAEKIGGSFHIALGDAYTYKEYMGTPVTVDNGNRSRLHWDITTMLWDKGGKIYADGEVIMDNGRWLDPRLSILNGAGA